MVYVLSWDKFLGKSWSPGKQESIGSEMGKAGLTRSGRVITHQSIRTLLANLPKYLGFVYIDETTRPPRIMVTDVGFELIKKHDIANVPKHKNLRAYVKAGDLIQTSEVFKQQMSKLIITNPFIRTDCENILVFPFRMTLKLLLELEYLDSEEIGYILFHVKAEDELPLIIEKIRNFRSLAPENRTAEIEAYKKTREGILTLVKAPTAGYYMYLCYSTGLCDRFSVKVNKTKRRRLPAIKLIDKQVVKELLKKFEDIEIFDFKDDWFLWKEYFSNPKRLYPPFDITIKTKSKEEHLITIQKDNYLAESDLISNSTTTTLPVFPNEDYRIIIYDLENGSILFDQNAQFNRENKLITIDISAHKHKEKITKEIAVERIKEMFSGNFQGFDREYYTKLKTIHNVLGKNYIDNRRKGGRLEYLFFDLLLQLKESKIVDDVFWFGSMGKYGICEPAPGGKAGNPDVIFEIDECIIVLELTTFRGNRAQWNSAEASSVPDHISKFKNSYPKKKIIGVFSAPSIHRQLEKNLTLNARNEGVGMIFIPCIKFVEFLAKTSRSNLKNSLIKEAEKQITKLN